MAIPHGYSPGQPTGGRSAGVDAVLAFLRDHRVFGVLPSDALADFARRVGERAYAKGHYLSYTGDPLVYVFVVRYGLVAMTKVDEHGSVRAALTLFPGDMAGLAVAVSDQRWRLSAVAVVDSAALLVHSDAFGDLYRRFPQFAQHVATELGELSRRSQQAMIRLTQASVAARVAAFLLESAGALAGSAGDAPTTDLALSQHDLALLLGSTRETVNRILVRFAQAGLIATSGRHVRLLRADALRRIAEG
ncbi:MAG: Crp/Fnr family transcriptional regulator [Chloroflexi bacterium]|nr:Crp/Fnr family transcriptional regulator [Chloroflexota bacterium]